MKLNNVIKTAISKADSFQAGNIKKFTGELEKDNLR